MKIIAVKTIANTGKQINVTKVHKQMGTFQGEPCNLVEYLEDGVKRLIEAPLLAK